MADVNDTGRLEDKHRRRLEQVENANINERDREAILAFHRHRRAIEGVKPNTLTNDLSALRNAAERGEVSLTDMRKSDVDDLLVLLATPPDEGGYGLDPAGSGMFNYRRALRVFYRWLDDRDDHEDYPFHQDIDLPKQKTPPIDEDELLDLNDVQALKDAAGRGRMNARDRALIAFLADGPRVTLASQLRVRDVKVHDKEDPTWKPNSNGIGHKGLGEEADRASVRPFLWSAHEVRRWLAHGHPDPDNPNAPLWTKQGYDPANPSKGALSPDAIRSMLGRVANRAGIEKAVNPHSFRHAAWTRCRRQGVDPEHLRIVAGWSDMRMLERYDHVSDDERNASVRGSLGLATPEDEDDDMPPFVDCWNCGEDVERGARFCSACGQVQDLNARMASSQAREDVRDGLAANAEDGEQTRARAAVLDALRNNDELLDDLAELLVERAST